jgi:hypothetical protein
MPRISEFFGILIAMYYNDRFPAHFHATYAGHEATYKIDTLEMISGEMPRRPNALVLEWAAQHRAELTSDWEKARQGLGLTPIEPLE